MDADSPYSRLIHFVNTYSIWVAFGSYCSHLFFCQIYAVTPNYIVASGLALGVWFIYTLDHLLDGITLRERAATARHKKHYHQRGQIKVLLLLVGIVLVALSLWVPSEYYIFIGILLFLTIVHFAVNYLVPAKVKRLVFLKEFFVALVVSLGIATSTLVGRDKIETEWSLAPFWIFFLINLANLISFSMYDKELDEKAGTLSIAEFYSQTTLKWLILLCLGVSCSILLAPSYGASLDIKYRLVFLAMQVSLALLCFLPNYFSKNDKYRFYGDLIYVYPLFVLPYQ